MPLRHSSRWENSPLPFRFWCLKVILQVAELLFLPIVVEKVLHFWKRKSTRPLTAVEKGMLRLVFANGIKNIDRIRIDEKASSVRWFKALAYVLFNTINYHGHCEKGVLVHEFIHIWQYQQYGATYIALALAAQRTHEGYDYGGVERIRQASSFHDFNAEQQGDIVMDYFIALQKRNQPFADEYLRLIKEIQD